jgi:hypothetical protein
MYHVSREVKRDPRRRWALPDRVFFGHGACGILAGVFLRDPPLPGFRAERIVPAPGHWGNHIYVTDGRFAFDYHGWSCRDRLLTHHVSAWQRESPGWDHRLEGVAFDLLDTGAMNANQMLGPDQYLHDPIPRAAAFIAARPLRGYS